jgi:hypothetical protein
MFCPNMINFTLSSLHYRCSPYVPAVTVDDTKIQISSRINYRVGISLTTTVVVWEHIG